MGEEPAFLVVEDHQLVQESLRRILRAFCGCLVVASCAEARRLLRQREWTGVIIDIGLPDGDGLELLGDFRNWDPSTPVLVMTGAPDDERAREAQRLCATYLPKPPDPQHVKSFAEWAQQKSSAALQLEAVVRAVADRHGLAPREAEALLLRCRGYGREEIEARMEVSPATLTSHFTSMRHKLGCTHLADAVEYVHRLLFEGAPTHGAK